VHPPPTRERAGWPTVTVVDRTDDPWKRSLVTSELIERVRDPDASVVCVSNTPGRARILACRSCRSLTRCERCDAAVGLDDERRLACRRCGEVRPAVCQVCGAGRFANLRPGVSRLREEIAAAAARPVVLVTGADPLPPVSAAPTVYVGTEAVLHRVPVADVVVFLEFDSELLAPRFRADEQALALIVRAGRLAPEVMIQTFSPDHEVLAAARAGDPALMEEVERARRRLLRLPPFGALAVVSGQGSDELVAPLRAHAEFDVGDDGAGRFLVRAADWSTLGRALNDAPRPSGSRVRLEVDPSRI
jgi:primosomal protein N' (replication factor Y)